MVGSTLLQSLLKVSIVITSAKPRKISFSILDGWCIATVGCFLCVCVNKQKNLSWKVRGNVRTIFGKINVIMTLR